jgi:hypothetical protein
LRISPRIIEERTVLIERMAADASSNGRLAAENDLRKKVDECLREVAHRSGQLALRPTNLLEHEARKLGVGLPDPHRLHQSFVVHEHRQILHRRIIFAAFN